MNFIIKHYLMDGWGGCAEPWDDIDTSEPGWGLPEESLDDDYFIPKE